MTVYSEKRCPLAAVGTCFDCGSLDFVDSEVCLCFACAAEEDLDFVDSKDRLCCDCGSEDDLAIFVADDVADSEGWPWFDCGVEDELEIFVAAGATEEVTG